MLIFILKRFGQMLLIMLIVSVLLFLLFEINVESVAIKVLGQYSTEEQRALWLQENGYYDPLYERYGRWLWGFVTGDLGDSVRFRKPINDFMWDRLWNTTVLAFWAMAFIVPLALVLGILSGMREGSYLDRTISVTSIITTSIPEFASAPLLAAIFVFGLGWLPGTSSMIGRLRLEAARASGGGARHLRLRLRGEDDPGLDGRSDDHALHPHPPCSRGFHTDRWF